MAGQIPTFSARGGSARRLYGRPKRCTGASCEAERGFAWCQIGGRLATPSSGMLTELLPKSFDFLRFAPMFLKSISAIKAEL